MTTTTAQPAVDLSARYIKINMKMSGWGNSKNAKEVAAEMEVARGAELGKALKAGKILLDPLKLQPVLKARNALTTRHRELTTVWDDSSWRLLPTVKWDKYFAEINPLIAAFDSAADDLEGVYLDLVNEARARLGGLFCEDDYPGEIQFREKFAVKLATETLAQGVAKNIALPAEEVEKICQSMSDQFSENMKRVQGENWQRLFTVVSNLHDSLLKFDKGEQRTVRVTLLEQIDLACSEIPDFNITADPSLIASIAEIRSELAGLDMAELREQPQARKAAIVSAAAIAAKTKARAADFAGYMN